MLSWELSLRNQPGVHWQSPVDQVRKRLSWQKSEGQFHLCQLSLSPQVFCQVNKRSTSESVTWYSQERRKLSFNFKELTTFCIDVKKKGFYTYCFVCFVNCNCVSCKGFCCNFYASFMFLKADCVLRQCIISIHSALQSRSIFPVFIFTICTAVSKLGHTMPFSIFRDGSCSWKPVHSL